MEKRWVVRRSEPVKEVLLVEGRVYPGAAQGTIGLRVQKRLNLQKYGSTRTRAKFGTNGLGTLPHGLVYGKHHRGGLGSGAGCSGYGDGVRARGRARGWRWCGATTAAADRLEH